MEQPRSKGRVVAVAVAAAAVVIGAVVAGATLIQDDPSTVATPPTTTSAPSSTSTTGDSTTSTVASKPGGVEDEAAAAVWPLSSTSQRYDDPAAAARGFALELVRFDDDVLIGDFREGDDRSGEIEIRPSERGPATTLLLRQLGEDDAWWVMGSTTDNIEVSEPDANADVASPLALRGRARAFEGTVEVELRADGELEPIGATFVTGSGSEELGLFTGEITFDHPGAEAGVLMFLTRSAEDGSIFEAVVQRVRF